MKYCLSSNCSKKMLELADEIYIHSYKTLDEINELLHIYPKKKFLIDYGYKDPDPYIKLGQAYDVTLVISSFTDIPRVAGKIKWFYDFPTDSFLTLHSLIARGASEILLGPTLMHEMKALERIKEQHNILYRANPAQITILNQHNMTAFYANSWVRPEDMGAYQVIDSLQFDMSQPKREAALFQIYKRGNWNGPIKMLIPDFPIAVNNGAIGNLTPRANCRLHCLKGYQCNICKNTINLAKNLGRNVNETN